MEAVHSKKDLSNNIMGYMKNHYLFGCAGPGDAFRDSNPYCNIHLLLMSQTEAR